VQTASKIKAGPLRQNRMLTGRWYEFNLDGEAIEVD